MCELLIGPVPNLHATPLRDQLSLYVSSICRPTGYENKSRTQSISPPRARGCIAMSFDSLLQDLDQRVDDLPSLRKRSWADRVHSVDEDLHASTSTDASEYARKLLCAARRSIAEVRQVPLDYRVLIDFLSESRVPVLDRSEFDWGHFLGSGYTMSVYQGTWIRASSPEVFALKCFPFSSELFQSC